MMDPKLFTPAEMKLLFEGLAFLEAQWRDYRENKDPAGDKYEDILDLYYKLKCAAT